jgi:hypothetical protein
MQHLPHTYNSTYQSNHTIIEEDSSICPIWPEPTEKYLLKTAEELQEIFRNQILNEFPSNFYLDLFYYLNQKEKHLFFSPLYEKYLNLTEIPQDLKEILSKYLLDSFTNEESYNILKETLAPKELIRQIPLSKKTSKLLSAAIENKNSTLLDQVIMIRELLIPHEIFQEEVSESMTIARGSLRFKILNYFLENFSIGLPERLSPSECGKVIDFLLKNNAYLALKDFIISPIFCSEPIFDQKTLLEKISSSTQYSYQDLIKSIKIRIEILDFLIEKSLYKPENLHAILNIQILKDDLYTPLHISLNCHLKSFSTAYLNLLLSLDEERLKTILNNQIEKFIRKLNFQVPTENHLFYLAYINQDFEIAAKILKIPYIKIPDLLPRQIGEIKTRDTHFTFIDLFKRDEAKNLKIPFLEKINISPSNYFILLNDLYKSIENLDYLAIETLVKKKIIGQNFFKEFHLSPLFLAWKAHLNFRGSSQQFEEKKNSTYKTLNLFLERFDPTFSFPKKFFIDLFRKDIDPQRKAKLQGQAQEICKAFKTELGVFQVQDLNSFDPNNLFDTPHDPLLTSDSCNILVSLSTIAWYSRKITLYSSLKETALFLKKQPDYEILYANYHPFLSLFQNE